MTLVIAKKKGSSISFTSDSRFSFGNKGFFDYGIKIFSVPVSIETPINSDTNESDIEYQQNLGMAVIGSVTNAYSVKEAIYEILQNLQYLPYHTNFSMDGLAKLIFKVYTKMWEEIAPILKDVGISEIIIGGFCPEKNNVRVYQFYLEMDQGIWTPLYKEILINDGIEFFGSGKSEGENVLSANPSFSPVFILREVIKSAKVDSVGGSIQYGDFVDGNFKVFGVSDYELNPDGSFKDHIYNLRGIHLYKDEFERDNEGFHISYKFIMPYEKEIDEHLKRYYDL